MPDRCGTNAAVSIRAPTRRNDSVPGRDLLAEQVRLAARGLDQPEQHAEARGLSRAVRAEQPAHLPAFDLEAEVVDCEDAFAVLLRQACDPDDGLGHEGPWITEKLPEYSTSGA